MNSSNPKTEEETKFESDDAKWQAVMKKDPRADGKFFYSVKTTGVFCLPSCPSRLALRENVAFHDSSEAAELAGFRARPTLTEEHTGAVAKACRAIETAMEPPTLESLAKAVGMSSFHFHRIFKKTTGLTPKAYATALRSRRVRENLPGSSTVTEAIYDAGYNSNSRFYAQSTQMLGMPAMKFRDGGLGMTIRFAIGECTLGSVLVAASDKGLCDISLGDRPEVLLKSFQDRFSKARLIGGDKEFEVTVAKVIGLIEAPKFGIDLPLDVRGTAFQQQVWQALKEIPAGSTVSYAEIAKRIGLPKAVRAVAGACAANTIAVAIPCHRVLRLDGKLSGYRWGVERKRALLERERKP